jgi:predicted transposase/invertase (TIGR01784 family)
MRGKDVTSLVVYVLLVLPTSVSSLPSSHLLKTRRIYSQGVDTVLSAAKEQVCTIPLAKISKLPAKVRASYEAQDREFDRYSQHTAKQMQNEFVAGRKAGIKAGKNSAKIEVARKLSSMNLTVDQIEKATGLSAEVIKGIK